MDAGAIEQQGLAAVAAAATVDEIEAVRVEYLGRKSALKLALREVRDRETGMALNAVRERLETAVAAREAELSREELDVRLREERVDVTLPAGGGTRGHLHLITQIRREVEDVFLGLGYRVVDGREVETTRYNFDGLNFPEGPSHAVSAGHVLRRRRDRAADGDVAVADSRHGGRGAAHLRGLAGALLPAGHAGRHAHADLPPG
jgi:phenylalanyl-tRNA synthetase alpha chain